MEVSSSWAASSLDSLVSSHGLTHVINFPYLTKDQINALLERHLKKYQFNVLNPQTMKIEPISFERGHGREYIHGHPENNEWLVAELVGKLPNNLSNRNRVSHDVSKHIDTSQRAMEYLDKHPHAAISHEPSGTIYLGPLIDCNNQEWVRDIRFRGSMGYLPKLTRRRDGCLHFKTSYGTKKNHRNPHAILFESKHGGYSGGNGKSMTDETSSEKDS